MLFPRDTPKMKNLNECKQKDMYLEMRVRLRLVQAYSCKTKKSSRLQDLSVGKRHVFSAPNRPKPETNDKDC